MQIQFDSVVNDGVIRIPEQYKNLLMQGIHVTVFAHPAIEIVDKTKAGSLSEDDFSEMKLDTRGWKFDREEANERR